MLSKSYIRAWADDRGVLDVIDLEQGRGYHISYQKATVLGRAYEPAVLSHDLEGEYARIEGRGMSAIAKLRGRLRLSDVETRGLIAFLDMYRYRGRYADRTGSTVLAVAVVNDGSTRHLELNYGDLMTLNRARDPGPRLTELRLENRPWTLYEYDGGLPTGDGAVMLFESEPDGGVSHVAFPLSPTELLVIGEELTDPLPIKGLAGQIGQRSNRWIIGRKGSLDFSQAARLAKIKAADRTAE